MDKKEYTLSLSRHYVSDWGLVEAVREILQNAIDNGDYEITMQSHGLTITNHNTTIPSSTLVLGNSSKRDDKEAVGQYGEGYKLALLVLLRNGYQVIVENGAEIWTPDFVYSDSFGCEVLSISSEISTNGNKDLSFIISGLSQYELNELKNTFLDLQMEASGSDLDTLSTKYGEIIKNPEFAGKMYVNGLPIYTDNDFKFGYNFKPEFVTLDRDRKSINRAELRKITTLALTYMEEPDYTILDKAIDNGAEDVRYLEDNISNMNPDFVKGYADYLKERFEIDDNTVVSTKNELFDTICNKYSTEISNGELKTKVVDRKIYSTILNSSCTLSKKIITETEQEEREKSKIEQARDRYEYSEYRELKEFYDKIKDRLNDDEQEEYINIISQLEPYDFDLIKDEIWG